MYDGHINWKTRPSKKTLSDVENSKRNHRQVEGPAPVSWGKSGQTLDSMQVFKDI